MDSQVKTLPEEFLFEAAAPPNSPAALGGRSGIELPPLRRSNLLLLEIAEEATADAADTLDTAAAPLDPAARLLAAAAEVERRAVIGSPMGPPRRAKPNADMDWDSGIPRRFLKRGIFFSFMKPT